MFPYIEQPALTIGSHTIYAFGILVGIGVVVGFEIIVRRAPKAGLDGREAARLAVWTLIWALVGSHVFSVVAYSPELLKAHPLEIFKFWGSMSNIGGITGGMLGGWVVMKRRGVSRAAMAGFLDSLAFAFPFGEIFGRGGCALAHDHLGIESTHWLAVQFPGGSRFDLGLLEFLSFLVIAGAFFLLDRRRWPSGFFLGLFFTLYGPVRFALYTLRIGEARYFGWTPAQYLSLIGTLAGVAVLVALLRGMYSSPKE